MPHVTAPLVQTFGRMLDKKDELADRVQARKHELLSKFNELKADTRRDAATARDSIKARLDDLEDVVKDGWDNMTDAVRVRLNKWLDKSEDPKPSK